MSVIPERTINFNVYVGSGAEERLAGVGTVDMPQLSAMTEELKGAGISGAIDKPTLGHFGSMTATINFHTIGPGFYRLSGASTHQISCRAAVQSTDTRTNNAISVPVSVIFQALTKSSTLGTLDVGAAQGTSVELEVISVTVIENNVRRLVINKMSMVHEVDGVDQLAEIKDQIG